MTEKFKVFSEILNVPLLSHFREAKKVVTIWMFEIIRDVTIERIYSI